MKTKNSSRKELSAKILKKIQEALGDINEKAVLKMKRSAENTAKKLAKKFTATVDKINKKEEATAKKGAKAIKKEGKKSKKAAKIKKSKAIRAEKSPVKTGTGKNVKATPTPAASNNGVAENSKEA